MFLVMVSTSTHSIDYESNVIVATDFSSSYYVKDRFPDIEDNFKKLSSAMTSREAKSIRPLLFQVIPIDELSQAKGTICEYTIQRKRLTSGRNACDGEAACSVKAKDVKTYIQDICAKTIIKRPTGEGTDIEGALSLAGQLSSAQRAKTTYLFIFSDMHEFRDVNIVSTPPNLDGFKVFVICGGVNSVQGFCMTQEQHWTKRLKKYGADSVEFVVESSRWGRVAKDGFQ
jgi:hypothetical protein